MRPLLVLLLAGSAAIPSPALAQPIDLAAVQEQLAAMQAEIERLFSEARFVQFQAGTDDGRDLKAWMEAFKSRVQQIATARCP